MSRIYLEARRVVLFGVDTGYYHLYLVLRDDPTPSDLESLSWRASGDVLRGSSGPTLHVSALGQAVFIDLGGRGNVIATLGFGPNGSEHKLERLVLLAFRPTHPGLTYKNAPQFTGSAALTGDLIPTLVTFTDLNDPKTARVVRPDMFEQEFGPGVRFRRATLEMVPAGTWPFTWIGWPRSLAGEPVTRGIEKKLPWLPHPRYLSGQFACGPSEPHCLHGGHLTRS